MQQLSPLRFAVVLAELLSAACHEGVGARRRLEDWRSQACLPGQAVGGRMGCWLLECPAKSSGGAESRTGLSSQPALP